LIWVATSFTKPVATKFYFSRRKLKLNVGKTPKRFLHSRKKVTKLTLTAFVLAWQNTWSPRQFLFKILVAKKKTSSKKTTDFLVSETLSERRIEMLALLGRRLFYLGCDEFYKTRRDEIFFLAARIKTSRRLFISRRDAFLTY
jgi:hypothetical protein